MTKNTTKYASPIALMAIAALGLGLTSGGAAAASAVGETQRCIRLMQIDESPIIDDRTILVKLRGNSGFKRLDLSGTCSGISWDGYARVSPEHSMCITDTLHVLGPTAATCKIDRIVTIDAAEASALEARKR